MIYDPNLNELSSEEIARRKQLGLKSSKMISEDSSYYLEEYDRNGFLISNRDKDAHEVLYTWNGKGKGLFCIEIRNNKPDTVWRVNYIADSILSGVVWNTSGKYLEEQNFDSKGRETSRYRYFHRSNRIDSIITTYVGLNSREIKYEKGLAKVLILRDRTKRKKESIYFRIRGSDTTLYTIRITKYNNKGQEVRRIEKTINSKEKIKRISTYRKKSLRQGRKQVAISKRKGKRFFKTIHYLNESGDPLTWIHKEKGYTSVSEAMYLENGLELKSITRIYRHGELDEVQEYVYEYTFYE